MFEMNMLGTLDPLSIAVSSPDGRLLGYIDDVIDEQSASLSIGINQQYTLSFTVTTKEGETNEWNEFLQEGMYLFVEKVGLFKMVNPSIDLDGTTEVKNITAYSCDSELEDRTIDLSINMGSKTSMEYLVTYEDGEDEELLNPYTGVPYDWILLYNTLPEQLTKIKSLFDAGYFGQIDESGDIIVTDISLIDELTALFTLVPRLKNKVKYVDDESVLTEYVLTEGTDERIVSYTLTPLFGGRLTELITYYTKYRSQLSMLDIVLEETGGGWTVGDIEGLADGDYSLANAKYQFEIAESLYSFLTNTLATTIECVVNFDILNRRVNITRVADIGDDTGIVIGYDTLVKTLNIATEEDKLATRLRVSGGDNLSITRVNFGSDFVFDLSYKMNTVDSSGKRVYVTDELAAKYDQYCEFREHQREEYIELSKFYEDTSKQIDEITYRVPNDGLQIDWATWKEEELRNELKVFKNQLATLKSLYKEDYYPEGMNPDGSIKESFIKNTFYWYDYYAIQHIISQIECALAVYPYYGDETSWTPEQIAQYIEEIHAWETEWTLFGTHELKAKIDTYKQNMDLLAESSVVRVEEGSYAIKTWTQLNTAQKANYNQDQSKYKYDVYIKYYNWMNEAQAYLDQLNQQIADLEAARDARQDRREELTDSVQFKNYFTADECKVIYRLFRDADYTNENILSTSIDTVSEKLDHMVELLEDAKDKVSETSRPQLTFTAESDNLLAIPEFKPLWDSFHPGNYIHVQYRDNTYVKVRLIGYTFNPRLVSSENFSMTFSNFTQSRSYYRDWASLLNTASNVGGSSYSSGGGTRQEDLDDTLTNSMLSKLLNSEQFGTRVTDVILDTIDVNDITARHATFGGLAGGTTEIDGRCLTTGYIMDWVYRDEMDSAHYGSITNTRGSIINLEDGKFNLGGGHLKFDGTDLTVDGALIAKTLSAGGKLNASHNHEGLYIDIFGNIYAGADNATKIYSNGNLDLCNGALTWDGSWLVIDGVIKAETGYIGGELGWTIESQKLYSGIMGAINGYYMTTVDIPEEEEEVEVASHLDRAWRLAVGSNFGVTKDGTLYGTNAHLTGDIVAKSLDLTTYDVQIGTSSVDGLPDLIQSFENSIIDINGVIDDLGTQLDEKIDTWAQSTDPSASWSEDALETHNGDLWYYTGISNITVGGVTIEPSKTYKYNYSTGKWVEYEVLSRSLFDLADGKSTIYYGTTSGTYPNLEVGDYLVDGDNATYRWNGSQWISVTNYGDIFNNFIDDYDVDVLHTDSVNITSSVYNGVKTQTITYENHSYTTYTTDDSDGLLVCGFAKGDTPSETDGKNKTGVLISKNGLLTANNAIIWGKIYATDGEFTGKISAATIEGGTISGTRIEGRSSISIGDNFSVDKFGIMEVKGAIIEQALLITYGSSSNYNALQCVGQGSGISLSLGDYRFADMYVYPYTIFSANVDCNGKLQVSNGIDVYTYATLRNVTIYGGLTVSSGSITIGGKTLSELYASSSDLTALTTRVTTLEGKPAISGNGSLNLTGGITVQGNINTSGDVHIQGTGYVGDKISDLISRVKALENKS